MPDETDEPSSVNWGTTRGGGGVNVGMRVCVGWTLKAAANVGSMVAVARGVGVGGASTTRNSPPETEIKEAYTHPVPLAVPGKEICTHSRAGETPSAGTISPGFNCPTIG